MEKNNRFTAKARNTFLARKILLMMKMTFFLLLLAVSQALAIESYSQETKLTLNFKNTSLREILASIEDQSQFYFLYSSKIIDVDRTVDAINIEGKNIFETLDEVLRNTNIKYTVKNRQILLSNEKTSGNFVSNDQQVKTISGKVTDLNGAPLPGVTVVIKGTTDGTITDVNGKYRLSNIPDKAILIFSFVGMKQQEMPVNKSVINVTMEEETIGIEEVVAVGYGTVKKRDLTGSVSSVGGEALKSLPVTSAAEALAGRLAGVTVTTTEGSPDAEIKIRVRGGGSITQDNSPLYIVDGFPVSSISDIPPADIQSIDVLKDASSTAIYGARGANGVIIITTKTAGAGKLAINYDFYGGIKKVAKKYHVLSPYQFAQYQYELAALDDEVESEYEDYFGSYDDVELYKYKKGTDWQDVVFGNTGTTFNHSLSIQNGTDKLSYNFSYNRTDNDAIMMMSDLSRDNLSLKVNSKPLDWLKFNFSARYSDTRVNGGGTNDVSGVEKSTYDSRLKNAVLYTPIELSSSVSASDDEEESEFGSLYPPTTTIPDNDRYQHIRRFDFDGSVSAVLIKNLIFRSDIGKRINYVEDDRFFGCSTYYVTSGDATYKNAPAVYLINKESNTLRNANTLNYNFKKLLPRDHNLSLLLGEEYTFSDSKKLTDVIENFPTFFDSNMAWHFTTEGVAISTTNYYSPDDKLLSFFGRLNYDYKDKYLVTGTFRADGSSKFAKGNRWGYFPSAAIAWRISDEPFLKNFDKLTNLKLRVSYGAAGNNNIDALAYMQTYSSTSTTYLPSSLSTSYWSTGTSMSNKDLKWETTISRNIGLDYGFFRNRLNGGIEVYKNTTKNLLIDYPVSGSGYETQTRNIGETSNHGLELNINAVVVDKKDFNLNCSFNISFNRNKVESLGGLDDINSNSAWTSSSYASNDYMVYVGRPVGLMYGFVVDGDGMYSTDDFNWNGSSWELVTQDQNTPDNSTIDGKSWGPGALKLKDLDGSGTIDNSDRTIIGNANPKFTGGFNINAAYRGLDFTAGFTFSYGNDIYNASKIEFTSAYYHYRNTLTMNAPGKHYTTVDYGSGDIITDAGALAEMNKDAKLWAPPTGNYAFTSWAVEDGSFLRLNNVTIGYTLPGKWTSRIHLQRFRIFVTGYNLYCWNNYSGLDPEVDTRRSTGLTPGVDYSAYPKSRSYNAGVNVTF